MTRYRSRRWSYWSRSSRSSWSGPAPPTTSASSRWSCLEWKCAWIVVSHRGHLLRSFWRRILWKRSYSTNAGSSLACFSTRQRWSRLEHLDKKIKKLLLFNDPNIRHQTFSGCGGAGADIDTWEDHGKADGGLNRGDDHGEAADDNGGEHVEDREDQIHPEQSNAGEQKENLGK